MRLKYIEIRNINELHCCWPVGFKRMSEFVELCWGLNGKLNDDKIIEWAAKIYDTPSEHNIHRLKRYIKYIMGFYNFGYKGILTHEDALYCKSPKNDRMFIDGVVTLFEESIPRIHEDGNINDGNHRIPIFSALGIKKIPVSVIFKTGSGMSNFVKELKLALAKFFESSEWAAYKKTDDYKILCDKKGSEVMGEQGHEKLEEMYTDDLKMRIGNTWASMMRCQDGDRWDQLDNKESNIKRYLDLINKYIPDKDLWILEIGAGDGGETKLFKEDGYKNIASITLGQMNIERAKQIHGIDSLKYMDMHFTSYRNNQFDAVVGFETYEHSPAPLLLGLELNRVLKFGGKLLLEVPYGEDHFPYDENPHHLNVLECWQARNMLKKCGFDNIITEEFPDIKRNVFYAEKIEEGSHNNHFNDIVKGTFLVGREK